MTIKDLAAITGYAVGTVSRALNNHPNVSEKARKTILEAALASGFQLNINAKQLKQQRASTILVVVKGTQNELFGEMVEVIQHLVARTAYALVVDYMDEDLNEVLRALQLVREKKPMGLLFLGGNNENFVRDFSGIDIPSVLVTGDASHLQFPNLSSVSTDDRQAGQSAIDALIRMGHRSIAVIGGNLEVSDTSRLRFAGCMDAFTAHSIDFDLQRQYRNARYSYQGGYQATLDLLDRGCRFSAIFAFADVMAIGAARALRERGLQVPEDVSVMGLDGLPLGSFLVPQLATVRQSAGEIARRSVEILLGAMESASPALHETVPFELQCRESVRDIT